MGKWTRGAARLGAMAAAAACCAVQVAAAVPDQLVCGFENVEDMVAIPGSPWLIGGDLGDAYFQKGGLHVFHEDTATGRKVLLAMEPGMTARAPYDQCPGPADPDAFSSHGLALKANGDGSYNLYAVNHGGRESIEVFEVTLGERGPGFAWIGCVISPGRSMPNALAVRADGGLVMSASFAGDVDMPPFHEIAKKGIVMDAKQMEQASKAMRYGAVFTWDRTAGWQKVAGSELLGNNGIELSGDGKWAYVNSHPGRSVTLMPLVPGLGAARTVELDFHPDNLRYSANGKLVATGHLASVEQVAACVVANDPHCALDYRVAEIDPATLAVREVFDGTGTHDFGAATVGLRTDKALWLGPVRGNCVARVEAEHLP